MARHHEAWGIEVGSDAIKAMKLSRHGDDVHVEDYAVLRFKQVLTTPDLDVDEAIRLGLTELIEKHDVAKTPIIASVPGNLAFARFAKLPPVEPKKIPDIVAFEAQQQIPFPIDQVEWDYQVFQQADSPDVEVGIFAITKERVAQWLANFRNVQLEAEQLTLSPLAVFNAFAFDTAADGEAGEAVGGTVYLDIGTVSTDVIIVEDGAIWLRTLPLGGNNFTEALVKQFKISFSRAEKLKREAATSKHAKQMFTAMRGVFADLVQELQRSLGFYQSKNPDSELTRLVGVGSTFRLPGLQKFLKQQLQMDVVRPDGFERIAVDGRREADFAANAMNLSTAYGLALQGVGLESVNANILPSGVLRTRMWKAKQPWFAAAAACVLAAAGVMAFAYFNARSQFDSGMAEVTPVVASTLQQANVQVQAYNAIQGEDRRVRIENLQRVVDYRLLMPRLIEDVSAAVASLNPQAQTLQPDYDPSQQSERGTYRRLYIEQLAIEYAGQSGPSETAGGDPQQPGGSTEPGAAALEDFFGEDTAPRLRVTLMGTTSFSSPTQLTRGLAGWLREHSEQGDRPYRFIVDDSDFAEIWQVTSADARSVDGAGAAPRRSAMAGRMGGGLAGGDLVESPQGDEPPSINFQNLTAEQLLPERPSVSTPQPGDSRVRVTWQVQLLPPAEARGNLPNPVEPVAAPPVAAQNEDGPAGLARQEDAAAPDDQTEASR
jgi:type IV pilus assembly protein PilM